MNTHLLQFERYEGITILIFVIIFRRYSNIISSYGLKVSLPDNKMYVADPLILYWKERADLSLPGM